MESLQVYIRSRGNRAFTLIEVMIVLSVLALTLSLSFGIHTLTLEHYSFYEERSKIILLLYRARSDAMNGICYGTTCGGAESHGVYLTGNQAILFQGEQYKMSSVTQDTIDLSPYMLLATSTEIRFQANSGNASSSSFQIYSVSGDALTSSIEVNSEGRIYWSN